MIVIGFYTVGGGTSYAAEAELFRASLEGAGMEYHLVPYRDRGGWDANTAVKPEFIRDMRSQLTGPLLYVDVDAYVHQNCTAYFDDLAEQGVDFAAHWFAGPPKGHNFAKDNCACLRGAQRCSRAHRLLSGTLFWGDTPAARALLGVWCSLNAACASAGWPSGGGQRNLWALVTAQARHLKTAELPGRYTYVFDKAKGYPPGEPCIIEHTIASRDHRARRRREGGRAARIQELRAALEPAEEEATA